MQLSEEFDSITKATTIYVIHIISNPFTIAPIKYSNSNRTAYAWDGNICTILTIITENYSSIGVARNTQH